MHQSRMIYNNAPRGEICIGGGCLGPASQDVRWWALTLLLLTGLLTGARAQAPPPPRDEPMRYCATEEIARRLPVEVRERLPGGGAFEREYRAWRAAARTGADTAIYQIPVVFHVVHRGQNIGPMGSNLPYQHFVDQIRILNEDYQRRPGTAGFSTDPRSGNAQIQFVLACFDPQGNPTNGVIRINGGDRTWTLGDDNLLKGLSRWPVDQYLNIWVAELAGNVFGYSSFPVTALPLGTASSPVQIDGIVCDYKYVGLSALSQRYNRGRTITHEVGHYLGLVHVWGDLPNCGGDDFCDDTPPQQGEMLGCPQTPAALAQYVCDPQAPPMPANYLNYTDDACMNTLTRDQIYRVRFVMRHSPNRVTLRVSPGLACLTPTPVPLPPVRLFNVRYADDLSHPFVYLDSARQLDLRLIDLTGRAVLELRDVSLGQGGWQLPLRPPAGMYLLEARPAGGQGDPQIERLFFR